jgi:hypothetical protein
METNEEYLRGEFKDGKLRLEQMQDSLVKIARLFDRSYVRGCCGWDYEFQEGTSGKAFSSSGYSYSTEAMCAFALSRLTSAAFWHERVSSEQNLRKDIMQKKNDCVHYLCTMLNKNAKAASKGSQGWVWKSATYGEEDPLTGSWIVELLSVEKQALDYLDPMVSKELREAIHSALSGDFSKIIGLENRAGAHAFLVYRLISAANKILKDPSKWKTDENEWRSALLRAGDWFEQNLHRQLSYYQFNDFHFDAPELIYCLTGALQTKHLRSEDPLISQVLDVIRDAQQKRSVYWRPYRPFLVKPQGSVLMPLTVEVADALLETLEETKRFDQLKESLANYYGWLMT